MRYFAIAQYDVRSPIVGFADTLPEGESEISFTVFASVARQTPGRVNFRKVYALSLWSWDISLTLNMTYIFLHVILNDSEESHRTIALLVVIARHEVPRQSL